MDEYDYLEAQVDAGAKANGSGSVPPEDKKERRSSSRDRDRKRSRSKDRRRSRSKDRRSRSRERRRERSRDRRDKDRDRDDRGRDAFRDRDYGRRRERSRTPPEVRMQREKEKELADLERTVRTIMVMNLNLRAEERDIFDFFVKVGSINDIKLIRDKNTKRSKGIAYVEFSTVDSAINALTLNGQPLMSMPVLVKPSEAEKNLAWEAQQQAKQQNQQAATQLLNKMGGTAPGVKLNPIKLQILNLHPDISEDDLKELFRPFGEINYVKVVRDPMGVSTGEGYVQYADKPMADTATKHFNGFDIAGRKLTVQVAPVFTPAGGLPQLLPQLLPMGAPGGSTGALPGPPGLPLPPGAAPADAAGANGAGGNEVDDLEEAETKTFRLNAQSRAALMTKLASSAGLQAPPTFLGGAAPGGSTGAAAAASNLHVPQTVLLDQGLLGPASPIPTPCILLKNMFSDQDKAEANWEVEVAEDVKSEASKFGEVLHCFLDGNSKGHVYLKFATQQAAEAASKALHGRYYSGNQIVVSYQFLQPYNSYFGLR